MVSLSDPPTLAIAGNTTSEGKERELENYVIKHDHKLKEFALCPQGHWDGVGGGGGGWSGCIGSS